jgi:PAS domain-containing protein
LVRQDGSHLSVNMLGTVLLDEQGLWIGHLAICIDITEQKRVHEALAARDRLLKKLSAHVPGGIFQFTLEPRDNWRFIYASDGMRDIYEIEVSALQQDANKVFERIHPQDAERVRTSIRLSALQLSHWREEYRVLLPQRGCAGFAARPLRGIAGGRYAVAWLRVRYFRSQAGGRGIAGVVHYRLPDRHSQPSLFPGSPQGGDGAA